MRKVYYPTFLDLTEKKAVVVGGGKVAERKILTLLKTGTEVTVISPALTIKLEKEKQKGKIRHIPRQYRTGDLKKAFLVVAATDSPVINEKVSQDAPCLVNVVDTPCQCNFIVPATVDRWPLHIAVSTSGISPALSRSIRRELETMYGRQFSGYLKALMRIRKKAMKAIQDKRKREEFLRAIASEKTIKMLRREGLKEAGRRAEYLFEKAEAFLSGERFMKKKQKGAEHRNQDNLPRQ
jgi:precorrin-2 dehydrogenase/sirohydrochlorin ferrochelatase